MARILVVDDSPLQVLSICRLIESLGHDALSAEDGVQAIALARQYHPELILMDVVMPGLDGFQATRAITRDATTGDIPVVMVTSKNQPTDRVWGMRQGARAYLNKPFTDAELAEVIQTFVPS